MGDVLIAGEAQRRPHVVYIFTVALSVGFVLDSIRYFEEAGFDISVISSPGEELDEAARLGATTYAVPMRRMPAPIADLRSLWTLYRLLRRIGPDITNVGTPKAALIGGLAAWLAGVPHRIYTVHGLRLETMQGFGRRVFGWMEWIACACAEEVLCVSASVRERIVDLKLVSPAKAKVLGRGSMMGIDVQRYAQTPESVEAAAALRCQLGIEPDALVIGFVGRLVQDKGVAELYDAFASIRDAFPAARLMLVGDYEPGDRVSAETGRRIERDSRVIAIGWQKDVAPYYAVMDIFVFPSHREGLGQVVLEAQASGVPVVATRATGVVDAVAENRTALLTAVGDAVALSRSLATLAGDPEMRSLFGEAGRAWVEEHFASVPAWQRLEAEYRQLLGRDASASRKGLA